MPPAFRARGHRRREGLTAAADSAQRALRRGGPVGEQADIGGQGRRRSGEVRDVRRQGGARLAPGRGRAPLALLGAAVAAGAGLLRRLLRGCALYSLHRRAHGRGAGHAWRVRADPCRAEHRQDHKPPPSGRPRGVLGRSLHFPSREGRGAAGANGSIVRRALWHHSDRPPDGAELLPTTRHRCRHGKVRGVDVAVGVSGPAGGEVRP
mmetsp:Transcript_79781/g.231574  ORF Transcript_79781/g.231574 Transcript_79781/m.231574 type:complete len:208 (-) Transcript_79781:356-979(-)